MDWNILLLALMTVETSSSYKDKPFCYEVGDNGRSVGCLQIGEAAVADVNRIYDTQFLITDREHVGCSKAIARKYLIYWGARYEGETGLEPTYEVYARIWNGGPTGWKKTSTLSYWNKVESVIIKNGRK